MDTALIPILIAVAALVALLGLLALGFVRIIGARRRRRERASRSHGHFVFAKIAASITPMERAAKYEKPLQEALTEKGYGIVTGGGTQLSRDRKIIEWVGLDIELVGLEEPIRFTCDKLRELGAPPGSVLQYTDDGKKVSLPIN